MAALDDGADGSIVACAAQPRPARGQAVQAREVPMLRCAYRTRNALPTKIQPARFFNLDSNGESKLARARFISARPSMPAPVGGTFPRFCDWPTFPRSSVLVRRRPKKLWLERNDREWLAFQRLGEVSGRDFRPLRHAHLIETVMRPVIVRPRLRSRSIMFLALRRLARSGPATTRISSALTRIRFVQAVH